MDSVFKEASLGRRLAAIAIDSYASYFLASAIEPHSRGLRLFLQLSILFVEISLLTALQGASFGQKIVKLKVVDSQSGANLSIPKVLLRTALIIVVIPALFRHDGRSVHDVLMHSTVVQVIRGAN